jgi:hypothetical protein
MIKRLIGDRDATMEYYKSSQDRIEMTQLVNIHDVISSENSNEAEKQIGGRLECRRLAEYCSQCPY